MKMFPHLWQRIFAYTFVLVVASHVINFMIFRLMHEKDMDLRIATELTGNIRAALQEQNLSNARTFLNFFDKSPHQLWIENAEGTILAGTVPPGLRGDFRGELIPVSGSLDNAAYTRPDSEKKRLLMRRQVVLDNGPANLYLLTGKRPPPPAYMIFIQGMIVVCVVGGVLSLWFAWSISRPLRRLRLEALEISEGNLDKRVSEQGTGEVLGVAQAVNRLSGNLSQNIKSMRQLLVNISHELRSPLARLSISTVIIEERLTGLLQRAGGNAADEDAALAAKHVKNAQQEIEHMEKLISASLLNSKLDLQQQKLNLQSLDFSEICRKMAERSEALLHSKRIDFQPDIQDGVCVEGDGALLGHMLSNLIDNAVKYTAEGGRVRLGLGTEDGAEGGRVILYVENSHSGLPEEVLKHMFDPFYRGGLATGSSEGVGLGLSLVEKIALCHRGRAAAENTETGVLVRVWLPQTGPGAVTEVGWSYVER